MADDPLSPQPQPRWKNGVLVGLLLLLAKGKTVIFILLTKLKFLLVGLKAFQLSKLLITFSTMALSVAAYSNLYGWRFALGLVLLILLHELGHGYAAKRLGLAVSAPIFIPFFGAVIALKEQPRSRWMNCVIGFGGPFAGMLSAVAVLACADFGIIPEYTHLFYGLAYFAFVINLFNLLPVFGLDGDRISDPMGAKFLALSAAAIAAGALLLVAAFQWFDPILIFIPVLLLFKALRRRKAKTSAPDLIEQAIQASTDLPAPSTEVSADEQRMACAAYLGLAFALGTLSAYSAHFVHGPISKLG